jgi:hypothetical protein
MSDASKLLMSTRRRCALRGRSARKRRTCGSNSSSSSLDAASDALANSDEDESDCGGTEDGADEGAAGTAAEAAALESAAAVDEEFSADATSPAAPESAPATSAADSAIALRISRFGRSCALRFLRGRCALDFREAGEPLDWSALLRGACVFGGAAPFLLVFFSASLPESSTSLQLTAGNSGRVCCSCRLGREPPDAAAAENMDGEADGAADSIEAGAIAAGESSAISGDSSAV